MAAGDKANPGSESEALFAGVFAGFPWSSLKFPQTLTGLPGGSKGLFLLSAVRRLRKPASVVCIDDVEAEGLVADMEAWENLQPAGVRPTLLYYPEGDPAARVAALGALKAAGPVILVTSQGALGLSTLSPAQLGAQTLELRPGQSYPRGALLETLAQGGYSRTDMVELEGELAVRGEVVDVWPPASEKPWRLLFDGDQLESLREFSSATQRSEAYLDPQKLLPVQETKAAGTLADHIPAEAIWFWDDVEPERVGVPESRGIGETPNDPSAPDTPERRSADTILYKGLPPAGAVDMGFHSTTGLASGVATAAQEAARWKAAGGRVLFFSHNTGESERLAELLDEQLGARGTEGMEFVVGPLRNGFMTTKRQGADVAGENASIDRPVSPSPRHPASLLVLTNSEIFGRRRHRARPPKFKGGVAIDQVRDIRPGDYVVHEYYGIGRYKGLDLLKAAGTEAEYLKLEYAKGDRLYVPLYDFKQVQKYSGSEGKSPRLNSLDTATWERVKARVKESVQDVAKDLLKVHAARAALPGYAYPPDSHLEEEFAASFLYEETADQIHAINDVKRDMESPRPMDRLILGDVGYGKTEVAMRAAFKAVTDSKQVAVLVPTTILAEQHFRTFKERFADYPARIGMLSRFQTAAEEKETLVGIASGAIDV
ncbi:MAG TPA: CarD family transcriptional regulator, partial [Elusimicrobiota bacterium]|nr:CarD family transcriptional regulator [Elusimicrobiota bacterium]